jgi:hypothetical protein
MQIRQFLVFSSLVAAMAACSSNEISNSREVAPETVHQQYQIHSNESDDRVNLQAQFRFGGSNGTTLVLNDPSNVSIDGEVIKVDSSKFGGAFYELSRSAATFKGTHRFVFTDINGKKYENSFVFEPLRLNQPPVSTSKKQPLVLTFEASTLQNGDQIEISTTGSDSSFSVSHVVSNNQNTVEIPAAQLARQKNNKLVLDITLQRSLALQQQTAEGGSMDLHQRLKALKIALLP